MVPTSDNLWMSFKCACLLLTLSHLPVTCSSRLLVVVPPAFSHIQPLIPALEELNDRYGHKATLIINDELALKSQLSNTSIEYIVSENLNEFNIKSVVKMAMRINLEGEYMLLRDLYKYFFNSCHLLLTDTKLLSALKEKSFDLVVIEKSPFTKCLNVLAYNLSVPFIHWGLMYDPINDMIPFSPSFVPHQGTQFSDKMTFYQRFKNTFMFLIRFFLFEFILPSRLVETYAPQRPSISASDLMKQVRFTLFDHDVLLDYPKPIMTNYEFIGGTGTQPSRPLTGELRDFMDSAKHGVVVVSFGSVVSGLPRNAVDDMLAAFNNVDNIKFVFKHGKSVVREKNILKMSWIPQNDLLGHPNTKLFITHCGNGGQFEALYHGVPMIGFPVFGDQYYNAKRIESKGFGIVLDIKRFTVNELVYSIKHVLEDKKYSKAIKLASEIFRNRPQSPQEKAAYWIDHVMKYGGAYMRPASLDMPFYQYLLLDVILFLFAVILAIIFIFIYLCKICKKCIEKKQKTQKKD